jgi:hypothetical protein
MKTIASRFWDKRHPVFYVSNLKGKIGDWGYTTYVNEAIHLSPYWRKRFNADCNAVGVKANFIRVVNKGVKL